MRVLVCVHVRVIVCVCVCVWERERERESVCVWERKKKTIKNVLSHFPLKYMQKREKNVLSYSQVRDALKTDKIFNIINIWIEKKEDPRAAFWMFTKVLHNE